MSFNAKSPISAPILVDPPSLPLNGTRGLFPMVDGWYEVDDAGNVKKISGGGGSSNDYTIAEKKKLARLPDVVDDGNGNRTMEADDYTIDAQVINVGTAKQKGVTLSPNGVELKDGYILLSDDGFFGIKTKDGLISLQDVLNSLKTSLKEVEGNVLDATEYNGVEMVALAIKHGGITIDPMGLHTKKDDFSNIMSNKGTLQAELDKIPPTTENNVLDLNKYHAIEGKQFGVNLNGQMGVQMNPNGFYTNKPDFSTIYTSDDRTLQEVLDELSMGGGSSGDSLIVDDALSETSTNPVQNKVVTEKFNEVATTVGNINSLLSTI